MKALIKKLELRSVVEGVAPGQYFVLVDVSKPGGKMVRQELFHGARAADKAAKPLRDKGRNVQVIDAMWYGPAKELMKSVGMSEGFE